MGLADAYADAQARCVIVSSSGAVLLTCHQTRIFWSEVVRVPSIFVAAMKSLVAATAASTVRSLETPEVSQLATACWLTRYERAN